MQQAWPGVRCEVDGPVGTLTLDRPERLNALDVATLRSLIAAAAWFDGQPQVKAVVVSGAGRAFCAGFDLTALPPSAWSAAAPDAATAGSAADPNGATGSPSPLGSPGSPAPQGSPGSPGSPAEVIGLGRSMADAVAGMSAVTVAAVHGACVGGGVVLALCCDLRLASTDATFALPEAALGIPLGWDGVRRLVREVGPAVARDLILSCRSVDAQEARTLGLVGRAVDPVDLAAQARGLADAVVRLPRFVIDTTLDQVRRAAADLLPAGDPADDVAVTLAALTDPESVAVRAAYLSARSRRHA